MIGEHMVTYYVSPFQYEPPNDENVVLEIRQL